MTLQFQSSDKPSSPPAGAPATGDEPLRQALHRATLHYHNARLKRLGELPDPQALRDLAARIRQHTLDHLDYYLEQFATNVQRNGGQVHFARDAAEACQIILDLAARANCRNVVQSQSMTADEIGLPDALHRAGLHAVQTELGRFIGQISHDRPSHPHRSMIHRDKRSIAQALSEFLKTPPTDNPQTMGTHVRSHLQTQFRQADMGITGANFLIAETGQVCLVSNDGNVRQCLAPRVLVTLAGIEKLVPRLADLTVLLKLLGRSATGQTMPVYTSILGGQRHTAPQNPPAEFHLVLLDNGRSRILAGDHREALQCIGCGACVNACPVYRNADRQTNGAIHLGPIGAVLTPLLEGLEQHRDLPQACTLCGVCADVCPVEIDLPTHLLNLRREIVASRLDDPSSRKACHLWAKLMNAGFLTHAAGLLHRWRLRRSASGTEWTSQASGLLAHWTQSRDLPLPAGKTFQQLWAQRPNRKEPSHD
ncbi:MAG TPA: lactate utilization protein B [Tepidisphaeraceae bacterium]|nr:lactate utilization protein B [Tepidisphaeraceae bacterium]